MKRHTPFGVWLLAVAVAVAGCSFSIDMRGGGGEGEFMPGPVTIEPRILIDPVPETIQITCGALTIGLDPGVPVVFGPEALAAEAADAIETAVLALGESGEFFDKYSWAVADQTLEGLDLLGQAVDPDTGEIKHAFARFGPEGDKWVHHMYGECDFTLTVLGYGQAVWILDSNSEPEPDSTTVEVLINEVDCASGMAPEGRAITPLLFAAPDSVLMAVILQPLSGPATCPSNPWHPVTVDLGTPLGGRQLFDGFQAPALLRPFPPTQRSIDSFGREP